MTDSIRTSIESTIAECLRKKFKTYSPESKHMPFHYNLLGKDRMALFSFIHSLNTTFGSSIFEPVAVALAKEWFVKVESQYSVGDTIYLNSQSAINNILNSLRAASSEPDKLNEIQLIRENLNGEKQKVKPTKVDLYLLDKHGEHWLFDLKSPKPNKGEFQGFKRTLLEWTSIVLADDIGANVHTLIAIPYNPYYPEPYERWTMRGLFDLPNEVKVAEEFWDFLGGAGTYQELLNCFERVGIDMRDEIDEYFSKFK